MIKIRQKLTTLKLPNKNQRNIKSKILWIVLILLISAIPLAMWSNIFAYEYNYFRCEGKPLEVKGKYYKVSSDEGYGIHPDSNYDTCVHESTAGLQRDPSTKAGAALLKKHNDHQAAEATRLKDISAYKIYTPKYYKISDVISSDYGDRVETRFQLTTNTGSVFNVQEVKKGNAFSYADLCSKPASKNWSGTIIGKDQSGRDICRTNPNKYMTQYTVAMNMNETAIMLRGDPKSGDPSVAEVTNIFNSMELYPKSVADNLR